MSRRVETSDPVGKPKSGESGAAVRFPRPAGVPVRHRFPCLTHEISLTPDHYCPGKVEEICGLIQVRTE